MTTAVSPANAEAVEAWDGPLFDVFTRIRHLLVDGIQAHSDEAMRVHPPTTGASVLDIGCGFGDTTLQLATLVGDTGRALGLDASPRFIEAATAEAEQAGTSNVDYVVADMQTAEFDRTFDYAFSRMGVMFFANPVAALRNVRQSMTPGGQLVMVVWRSKDQNEFMLRAQQVVERHVTKPEDYDQPTCGPGPFSMANADTVSGVLKGAGFEGIALRRCDHPVKIGDDIDEAVSYVMSIGPAGEILRLQGERAEHLHEQIAAELREEYAEWITPEGVFGPASTWIVSATA